VFPLSLVISLIEVFIRKGRNKDLFYYVSKDQPLVRELKSITHTIFHSRKIVTPVGKND
jgi:hypothetical protein